MNNDLIFYQILPTTCNSLRKCMEIETVWGIFTLILGIKGVER